MQPSLQRIVTAVLIVATCIGCTDKDREMAGRTSDGSETFKFKPPENAGVKKSSSAPIAPAPSPAKPSAVPPKDSDGSDTFHFKQDPRTLPKSPTKAGK